MLSEVSKVVRALIWNAHGGSKCKICGHEYKDVEDMLTRSIVKYNNEGGSACRSCWESQQSVNQLKDT